MKIILNSNASIVGEVRSRLNDNLEKYGKRYCPCKLEHTDDTVCMCKEFSESEEPGECHCGLFVKLEA